MEVVFGAVSGELLAFELVPATSLFEATTGAESPEDVTVGTDSDGKRVFTGSPAAFSGDCEADGKSVTRLETKE